MKLIKSWLKEYIPTLDLETKELVNLITKHIVEVEGVESSSDIKNVVVGEVKEVSKHPGADKLSLCVVDTGDASFRKIVCGAPNVAKGQKVVVALPGSVLPGGFEIKEREVRGITSLGMICAEDELGLGDNHDGIMVLPLDAKVGESAFKYLGKGSGEEVIEIENKSLTNRPDLFGHLGMAREIATISGLEFVSKDFEMPKLSSDLNIDVKVSSEKCNRYMALAMDVKVGPSPDWLKAKMEALGLRSINNVVDITNYVMFDSAQPLHAFDLDKLAKKGDDVLIEVREAKEGESMLAIDGKTYNLGSDNLVIADAEAPVALAGIMGGKNTEVGEDTKRIVLEIASFDGSSTRNTSMHLGLVSESSVRYARNLSPWAVNLGVARAVKLLVELASAKIIGGSKEYYPKPVSNKQITFSIASANKFIGQDIGIEKIKSILTSLGLEVLENGENISVNIPAIRSDLNIPEDIYEEIARIFGYETINRKYISGELVPPNENLSLYWDRVAKTLLEGLGFSEVYNYSFTSGKLVESLGMDTKDLLKVKNAISPENEYMRMSLIPNMLTAISKNLRCFDEFSLFEMGKVYYKTAKHEVNDGLPINEKTMLLGVVVRSETEKQDSLYKYVKGIVATLTKKFGISLENIKFKRLDIESATFHPGKTAIIEAFGKELGYVGEIHPAVLDTLKINSKVGFFDLNFENLMLVANVVKDYDPISEHPSIERDLAFVVAKDIDSEDVAWAIEEVAGDEAHDVEHFDTYEGKGIPEGKKSLAFRVVYQDPKRTLKEEEVNEIHSKVVEMLKTKFKAEIRN